MKKALVAAGILLASLPGLAWAQAETTLNLGFVGGAQAPEAIAMGQFAEEVKEKTGGRIEIRLQGGGALGGDREVIEGVQLGTVDMTIVSTSIVVNFDPSFAIFDIPFLFRDYDHARKVLDGKIGQDILKKFQSKGLVGLVWGENGFRHMTNSKHAIRTPADAAGLKMRTMENKVHMEGYKAFGILPTPMAFTELFTALQQGTVDGQENPIPVILSAKFSQVQKYLSLTGHVYSPATIIMNPGAFGKLSADDKKVFLDAAKAGAAAMRKRVNDDEARGIAILRKEGVEVTEKVDGEAFRKAIAPAYAGYAKEFGADNIAAIQAVR